MQLWDGLLEDFRQEIASGLLYSKMAGKWVAYHDSLPGDSEFRSWQNSLPAVSSVMSRLPNPDLGIVVEYHFPYNGKRLDVALFGKHPKDGDHATIIELKQWDRCELYDDRGDNLNLNVGGQLHLHPSEQAFSYLEHLKDFHSAFSIQGMNGRSCSYLHNYRNLKHSPIHDARFSKILQNSPAFGCGDEDGLLEFLKAHVGDGQGEQALRAFMGGYFRPSKKIIDSLSATLQGNENWHLLDDQRIAYNDIIAAIKRAVRSRTKSVFIVRGAPGTGKSVVAVQLLKDTLALNWKSLYFTPGQGFRANLHAVFDRARRLMLSPASIRRFQDDELDLALVDESHRLTENATPYMPLPAGRTPIPEIIVDKSKVTVFFIDDRQRLRPLEVGKTDYLSKLADHKCAGLKVLDLETQFRCRGSLKYIRWVERAVYETPVPSANFKNEYNIEIVGSPEELEARLWKKCGPNETARIVAGFCWPWSDPNDDGTLVGDVKIGDWERPWNLKRVTGRTYRPHTDPYALWARTDEGLRQIGCIYSSQGLEFDHVGVIWGKDLVRRSGKWEISRPDIFDAPVRRNADDAAVKILLQNAYMVLLTRGMKSTTIFCCDAETLAYLKNLMELSEKIVVRTAAPASEFRMLADTDPMVKKQAYKTLLPFYSLKAAAGKFGPGRASEERPSSWIEVVAGRKLDRDMFVCQIVGDSMEPRIPSGSHCIFKGPIRKSVNGRIVLAVNSNEDPDLESSYVVKIYERAKTMNPETGLGEVTEIRLKSLNKAYPDIPLRASLDNPVSPIIAEFIDVLETPGAAE